MVTEASGKKLSLQKRKEKGHGFIDLISLITTLCRPNQAQGLASLQTAALQRVCIWPADSWSAQPDCRNSVL